MISALYVTINHKGFTDTVLHEWFSSYRGYNYGDCDHTHLEIVNSGSDDSVSTRAQF